MKVLGGVLHHPDPGVKMSLPRERGHARGAYHFSPVGGVVVMRRVKGGSGEMPLVASLREVIGIGSGSVKVMADLIEGMIDMSTGEMIDMSTGEMIDMSTGEMTDMSTGEMMTDMSAGEMIDMIAGEMTDMSEGEMMIDMSAVEMMDMSEGEMMIDMNKGEMMMTGEEVIAQEMAGMIEGRVKTEGMMTGTQDEMRTKGVNAVGMIGREKIPGEEVRQGTDMTALDWEMTTSAGRIGAQGTVDEGGGVMEIGSDVEMTVMWGVGMVTDGEEIGGMIVSGVETGKVTGLHAAMIVIGRIEVAMVTDKMTEIMEGV